MKNVPHRKSGHYARDMENTNPKERKLVKKVSRKAARKVPIACEGCGITNAQLNMAHRCEECDW